MKNVDFRMKVFVVVLMVIGILFCVSAYADISRNGLVAEYLFDGNADDSSGNGNHGVINGNVSFINGKHNNCIDFETNSWVQVPNSSSLKLTTSGSWGGWIQIFDLSTGDDMNSKGFIAKGDLGAGKERYQNNSYGILITNQKDPVRYYIDVYTTNGTNYARDVLTIEVPDTEWHHIMATFNNGTMCVYFDGTFIESILTEYSTINTNSDDLGIGREPILYRSNFQGNADEVLIYNRALSESEVQELYRESEEGEDRYDEGYEAGKQYCINNPSACGWIGGYSQSDLDSARQEGYNSGCNDCSNGSSIPATISPELNMHIPVLQYQSPFGAMDLWADFEFAGESDGDMLWKLSDFGQK